MIRRNQITALSIVSLCLLSIAPPAYAIDKRLKLAFKLGGYGAAGGAVIGAGTMAMGLGGFRNVLMGASSGLYAGLAFAAYLIATPPESQWGEQKHQGPRNPYGPRKAVGPDNDYEQDDDELQKHIKQQPESYFEERPAGQTEVTLGLRSGDDTLVQPPTRQLAFWTPLVSLEW